MGGPSNSQLMRFWEGPVCKGRKHIGGKAPSYDRHKDEVVV